jgi:hypothetical protein
VGCWYHLESYAKKEPKATLIAYTIAGNVFHSEILCKYCSAWLDDIRLLHSADEEVSN